MRRHNRVYRKRSWLTTNRIKEAVAFSKQHMPDAFLAVGGGSVMDTAKLMNLYTCNPGGSEQLMWIRPSLKGYRRRIPRLCERATRQGHAHTGRLTPIDRRPNNSRHRLRNHWHRHLRPSLEASEDRHRTSQPEAYTRHMRPLEHANHAFRGPRLLRSRRPLPLPRKLDSNSLLRAHPTPQQPHRPSSIPRRQPHLRHLLPQSPARHRHLPPKSRQGPR